MSIAGDTITGTMPPTSIDSEEAIVGALLLQPDILPKVERLKPDDFHSTRCSLIYTQICKLDREGKPIDAITVAAEMDRLGLFEDAGGAFSVIQCMEKVQNVEHVDYYVEKVLDSSKTRKLIYHFRNQIEKLYDPQTDVEAVLAESVEFRDSLLTDDKGFDFITTEELFNSDDEIEYLIDGVMVAGQPCIVSGPKKCLKTNTMIDMCLSLSSGSNFLGKWRVPREVKVGIMSGESGKSVIRETAKRIAESKCLSLMFFNGVYWSFDLPDFGDAAMERQLERFIEKEGLEVLMIDPAYLCLPLGSNAGNMFEAGPMLRRIGAIGERTSCTIILAHHMTKSGAAANHEIPGLEDIAWAGFQEFARQWILLNRREAFNGESPGSHKLWFHAGGSAGHCQTWALDIEEGSRDDEGGRRWEVEVVPVSDAKEKAITEKENSQEKRLSILKEANLKTMTEKLSEYPEGLTLAQIRPKLEWGDSKVKNHIEILCEREVVRKERKKCDGNGQEYDYYLLSDNHPHISPITSPGDAGNVISSPPPHTPIRGVGVGGDDDRPGELSDWLEEMPYE